MTLVKWWPVAEGLGLVERDWGWWPKFYRRRSWLPGEKWAQWGEHRTEVTEVTEGGLGLVAKILSV